MPQPARKKAKKTHADSPPEQPAGAHEGAPAELEEAAAPAVAAQPTRLFVSNLPPNAIEADLRRLFEPHGRLTDVQLKYAADGRFRRFGFVGFRSAEAAADALAHLDGAYVGSTRIQVAQCRSMPQQEVAGESGTKKKAITTADKDLEDDLTDEMPTKTSAAAGILARPHVVKLKGCPPGIQARNVREFFAPLTVKEVKIAKTGCAYARMACEADAQKALEYNKHPMGKKKVLVRPMTAAAAVVAAATASSADLEGKRLRGKRQASAPEAQDAEEKIMDTGRLFVRNLPYDVTEAELTKLFEPYGQISELHLSYQSLLKRNKGFAFVAYLFPEHALKAFKALDRCDYMGRCLHVLPGDSKPEDDDAADAAGDPSKPGQRPLTSYQRMKAQELRAVSGTHSASWNALFLGADAVASLVSQQLGEAKATLLAESERRPGDGSSVAVRLAHGEADLVGQTRRFLEANGVDLASFGQPAASTAVRSDRVFLAKNLPPGTTADQLSEVYAKFPGFERLVLPPHRGVTAVVSFATPQEARTAYKQTAFSRMVDRPLYLEWAPLGCLKPPAAAAAAASSAEMKSSAEEDARSKVLIRNVAFEANSRELRALLEPFGELVAGVRLPKKPEGGHRGFAFAQFASAESARRAVEQLSGATHLYGRRLLLELSGDVEGADGAEAEAEQERKLRKRAALGAEAERAVRRRGRVVLDILDSEEKLAAD